jgi:glycine betaine/proline transport system ATP-binding protein
MNDVAKVKLACRGVWKVFGRGAEAFMAGSPSPEALAPDSMAKAGLMAGVRDVTVEIGEGEIFIVMGLSGSGKSTLLRCMSRLVEPTAGEVLLEGKDLLKASEAELIDIRRHKMGMVFQHFALLPHLTVLDNVAFPLAIQKIAKAEREQRARGDRIGGPRRPRERLPAAIVGRPAAARRHRPVAGGEAGTLVPG